MNKSRQDSLESMALGLKMEYQKKVNAILNEYEEKSFMDVEKIVRRTRYNLNFIEKPKEFDDETSIY